jgi:cell wall-associated NlpC family hydrolase
MPKNACLTRGLALLGVAASLLLSIPAPSFAGGVYFVKPGDTLSRISRLFGVGVDKIVAENHLDSAAVKAGDKLRIPTFKAFVEANAPLEPPAVVASRKAVAPVEIPAADVVGHREVAPDRMLQALCREETVYHSIVRGETLSAIATRYSTEIDSLLQLNGLKKRSRLSIGQKIIVRKSGPHSHTVARGETLADIAARYGFEAAELARLNHLDGEKVAVGMQLLIQPCDPYATAGSAPPPLGGTAADVDPLPAAEATQQAAGSSDSSFSAPTAAIAQRVINLARTMLNVPYRFGGSTLRGIDCSAYVQRVFGMMDVPLPRTAREQYSVGARVSRDDIQIGDLLFFRTYASFPSHVGIYLGENLFIHASSMVRKVSIDSIDLPYYRKRFIGARRLVVDGSPAVASTP